jgi:uncharacterized protein (DUF2236 family)
MHGRLRRTARFIALTTYGSRSQAEDAIARVRQVHNRVHGTLPGGEPYTAGDPDLLAWVHVTETFCFLEAWRRYAEPAMPLGEQNRYFAEMIAIGTTLGAAGLPDNLRDTRLYMQAMGGELEVSDRTREVTALLLDPPAARSQFRTVQRLLAQAAIDLLPSWARELHGLRASMLSRPAIQGATAGMAGVLRWAFR